VHVRRSPRREGRVLPWCATAGLAIGAAIVAVVIIGAGAWLGRDDRWTTALGRGSRHPQLVALPSGAHGIRVYAARQVEAAESARLPLPGAATQVRARVSLHTNPPGATVWRKKYAAPDSALDVTRQEPLDSVLPLSGRGWNVPQREPPADRAAGLSDPRALGIHSAIPSFRRSRHGDPTRDGPDRRRCPRRVLPGLRARQAVRLGDYLMDPVRVTNAEFKRFVDAARTRRRGSGSGSLNDETGHPNGHRPWAGDRPDRPARAFTWEAGEYRPGRRTIRLAGVAVMEGGRVRQVRGQSLPTVAHWNHAASVYNSAWVCPASNLPVRNSPGRHPPAASRLWHLRHGWECPAR